MKFYVKNTTVDLILSFIYPCYCRGCGKIGTAFCYCCYFNNTRENPAFFSEKDKNFRIIMACGLRRGLLGAMVAEYKYDSRRHFAPVFARYLFDTIKRFKKDEQFVLVPLPTISRHIRSRGFDHIGRICEELSRISGFKTLPVLERAKSAVQVGADAKTRLKQAKEAYKINSKARFDPESHFLLVDDVWTTGASMRAARDVLEAELLRLGLKKSAIKISAICLVKNDGYEF